LTLQLPGKSLLYSPLSSFCCYTKNRKKESNHFNCLTCSPSICNGGRGGGGLLNVNKKFHVQPEHEKINFGDHLNL
jgi:hypothetical protein